MTSEELKQMDDSYVMHTYGRFPIAIEHGEGATVYDYEGNKYIDFTSGIGVNCLGYGNQGWADAIYSQAKKLGHMSNLYYTEPCAQLAKTLCKRTGMSKVFFGNSGAEANEGMIKLARKYSYDKYGEGRATIITLQDSFHGRTITTLNATGQDVFHKYFFPFTEGFRHAKANDMDDLKAQMGDDVCAVMLELIQGEGGVNPLDPEYVKQVREFCTENDLLMLVDEVQTGVGRTGSLFCFQSYDLKTDVVSFAKGIAGGLPMGGIMAAEPYQDVLGPGTHASTFGGNPIAAAAGNYIQSVMDDKFLSDVQAKGDYMRSQILGNGSPFVEAVQGKGLMIGIRLSGLRNIDVCNSLNSRGLLTLTAGNNVLRLLPPLAISTEEIDEGLDILLGLIGN